MSDLDLWPTFDLLIAQDGAAGLPGSTPAPGGTGADGALPAARPTGMGGNLILLLIGMMVLLVIFSSIGPRRERKKREAMIASIKKHDKVQTVGGVIGAIVELKSDTVVLKVDETENTRIMFARSAIQQVLSSRGEDSSPEKSERDARGSAKHVSSLEPGS